MEVLHEFSRGPWCAQYIRLLFWSGAWCWIKDTGGTESNLLRLFCFYLVVWVVFVLSSACYFAVYCYLRRFINVGRTQSSTSNNDQK